MFVIWPIIFMFLLRNLSFIDDIFVSSRLVELIIRNKMRIPVSEIIRANFFIFYWGKLLIRKVCSFLNGCWEKI
ncbi:hypothetical protein CMI46_00395 [Candidatus Pacearchaeota archaeon]|nr:hypothetical protein [Candidatus Pacearchaeota archaeon]